MMHLIVNDGTTFSPQPQCLGSRELAWTLWIFENWVLRGAYRDVTASPRPISANRSGPKTVPDLSKVFLTPAHPPPMMADINDRIVDLKVKIKTGVELRRRRPYRHQKTLSMEVQKPHANSRLATSPRAKLKA